MKQGPSKDIRVQLYEFDDPVLNDVINRMEETIEQEKIQRQKRIKYIKIVATVVTFLFIAVMEYFLIMPIKKDGFIADLCMVIFPLLGAFFGYAMANYIIVFSSTEMQLFYSSFRWAKENQYYYTFTGILQDILRKEHYWSYIVVESFLWRMRNDDSLLEDMRGKEVKMLLIDSFDDDMNFEGLHMEVRI